MAKKKGGGKRCIVDSWPGEDRVQAHEEWLDEMARSIVVIRGEPGEELVHRHFEWTGDMVHLALPERHVLPAARGEFKPFRR